MKNIKLSKLIVRERRGYLFAALCSATAALMIFYKLLLNDLYVKILGYPWMAIVLGCLIVGNLIHGFFAFKSFQSIDEKCTLAEIKKIKVTFYKSLIVNFLLPYLFLIILFVAIKEFGLAVIALLLFLLMSMVCYVFDLRPVLSMREKE
ncbi:MAG: hypothetical protein H7177_06610 [Rhizobacter sp.]|nr:hypothetical protein [Bacteriovorax sp.]